MRTLAFRLPRSSAGFLVAACCCSVAHAQGDPARVFDPATAATRKPGATVRIDLIGDSTQTENAGYGRGWISVVRSGDDYTTTRTAPVALPKTAWHLVY